MEGKPKTIPPKYIGDGLYMRDNGHNVAIAVGHHSNDVAYLDKVDIDAVIDYLTEIKNK
jgi:hypothetical protein